MRIRLAATTLAILASTLAPALAVAADGDPQVRSRSFDGPRVSGTQTATIDRTAGNRSRETMLTRHRDGATASRSFERQRGEGSITTDRAATDFQGRTRSSTITRARTETGARRRQRYRARRQQLHHRRRAGPQR